MPIVSGGGGGGGPAAGSYLPVANKTGVTVDSTTYADGIAGGGAKLTTVVFPGDQGALAIAIAGDAFPRWLLGSEANDYGLLFGDGTINIATLGTGIFWTTTGVLSVGGQLGITPATNATHAATLGQLSPKTQITSGALPTLALVSGAGAQVSVDRDAETVTPFTGDGTNNAATCAIALSPDNLTYSTVATISIAAALNLTGVLTDTVNARVPAGWYLKLTAVHGTIGTTTYY